MARRVLPLALLLATLASLAFAQAAPAKPATAPAAVLPYEAAAWADAGNGIDRIVGPALEARGSGFRLPASEAVLLRRVYLDLLGTLPLPSEIEAYAADRGPDRYGRLLDRLFSRPEFADYQALHWCDLLGVKSEFPINLWPNAVQAYHRWVRDSVAHNLSYDRLARALLLGGGSSFRDPPSNFYRAVEARSPEALAGAVSLTFMGVRPSSLPPGSLEAMSVFWSGLYFKKTLEWKEEVVCLKPADGEMKAVLPDGRAVTIPPSADPRVVFADWLIDPANPYFARAIVNRTWARFMGTGLIRDLDNSGPGATADCPELLDYLASRLVASGWDLRALYREILESRCYRQSSLPTGKPAEEGLGFAFYQIRRLDAEVLADALSRLGPAALPYSSAIPEPFTYIPLEARTISLADGSITSDFLVKFGRPSRNAGTADERDNSISSRQLLHLLNSTDVRRRIEAGPLFRKVFGSGGDRSAQVREVYLSLLSRPPEKEELRQALSLLSKPTTGPRQAAIDLVWALVNSKEFLYAH
jgi:hypothetical protein